MKRAAKIFQNYNPQSRPDYTPEEWEEIRRNLPKVGAWSMWAEQMRERRANPDMLYMTICRVRNDVHDRLDEWSSARGLSPSQGIDLLLREYDEQEADRDSAPPRPKPIIDGEAVKA